MVDLFGTKRQWIICAQLVLAAVFLLFVPATLSSQTLIVTIVGFSLMALISATQDVAIDAYYLISLDKPQQSYFVGVRNAVYKMAILFGQSVLVGGVGFLHEGSQRADINKPGLWLLASVRRDLRPVPVLLNYFGLPKDKKLS